eukprot:scaffold31495_cov56-Phaeocystis_antarctica.AAC.1
MSFRVVSSALQRCWITSSAVSVSMPPSTWFGVGLGLGCGLGFGFGARVRVRAWVRVRVRVRVQIDR